MTTHPSGRSRWKRSLAPLILPAAAVLACATCAPATEPVAPWAKDNPVLPLPSMPLGVEAEFATVGFEVTPEKVRLGRWLFFDPRLSVDGTISCASCHRPDHAFSEPTPHSTGFKGQVGTRKAPPVINAAWPLYPVYFWDGRAASLVDQAKGPMENPIEMASSHPGVVDAVASVPGYRTAFEEAYGEGPVTIDRIAEAIAAYEATRLSGNSPWDRYQAGDAAALTPTQKQGSDLFFGKAQCAQCHIGWNFTDAMFHNLGIGWDEASQAFADVGRTKISGDAKDTGAFKTPTLREVTRHAPFMHDGSVATLREVMDHYNKGGTANPWLSERILPLDLTPEEIDALVAFMQALEGEGYQDTAPPTFPM